ncbi:MAG: hypothetical protein JKX78_15090 [Alteromonadaceae bacterium]|nr:hypothetical protein [Alteromonadaceae bacterium]
MFSIHGEWKIAVNNNILLQWFGGSWNEEAIIAYVKEFREKATPLSLNKSTQGKWAILSIFEDWELGVPAIEHHVEEHCQWFKDNGCIKDCHVYTPNATKTMQLEKMIPHTDGNYERCVFSQLSDAKAWLAQNGFVLGETTFFDEHSSLNNTNQ